MSLAKTFCVLERLHTLQQISQMYFQAILGHSVTTLTILTMMGPRVDSKQMQSPYVRHIWAGTVERKVLPGTYVRIIEFKCESR